MSPRGIPIEVVAAFSVAAFSVMVLMAYTVKAQTVGEQVEPRAVCMSREMVERHVKWSEADKNYDRANKEFLEAGMVGECIGLPVGMRAAIEEVGVQSEPFVDKDGDLVRLSAIRVKGFWTMYLELLGKGGKS